MIAHAITLPSATNNDINRKYKLPRYLQMARKNALPRYFSKMDELAGCPWSASIVDLPT